MLRVWRGIALSERTTDYLTHLQQTVVPELSRIAGYRGVSVLRRDLGDGVEITVQTLWASLDAIRQFAGEPITTAVVAPEAQALFRSYDATVTHFQAMLHDQHSTS